MDWLSRLRFDARVIERTNIHLANEIVSITFFALCDVVLSHLRLIHAESFRRWSTSHTHLTFLTLLDL